MRLNDDDIARVVADGDQLTALMASFAVATVTYFTGLMNGGMNRDEAMALTAQWHEIWLMSHLTTNDPGINGF